MVWYKYEKIELSKPVKYGIFLILYVAFCLFVFSIINDRKINRTVKENLGYSTRLQAVNIDKVINAQVDALKSYGDFISKQESLHSNYIDQVADSLAANTKLSRVYVIAADGTAYVNGGGVYNASDRSYFERAMQGEVVIDEPTQYIINEEYRIVISVPIYKDDKIIGVVAGSFDLSDLNELVFINLNANQNSYAFIMSRNGDLISINDRSRLAAGKNFFEFYKDSKFDRTTITQVKQEIANGKSDCYLVNRKGEERYISINPLGVNNWVLGFVVSLESAHSQYDFIQLNEMVLFAFIGMGFVVYLLLVLRNIRHEKRTLIKQATLDPLTSLLNKRSTEDKIKSKLDNLGLKALLIIDIDNFKWINDSCGHSVGDLYIKKFADTLKSLFRKEDIIGRIGGDEMMVFMTGLTSREDAFHKAESLLKKVKEISIEGETLPEISCSIGIVFYPHDGKDFGELYKKADLALYAVKNRGKDGYDVYYEDI